MKFIGIAVLMMIISFNYMTEAVASQYYPNFIGNTWTLKGTDDGEERILKVAKTTVISGWKVNVLERRTPSAIDEMYIFTDADGVKMVHSITNVAGIPLYLDYNPPGLFLPAYLEVGVSWEIKSQTALVKVSIEARVIAQEDVTTSIGTFRDCFKIRQDYSIKANLPFLNIPSLTTYMWLAPNIGIVKEMDSSQRVFELVNYKLFYPWDVNGDLKINLADLSVVESYFGEYFYNVEIYNPDVNRDGIVDISDLALVGKYYGETYSPNIVMQNKFKNGKLIIRPKSY